MSDLILCCRHTFLSVSITPSPGLHRCKSEPTIQSSDEASYVEDKVLDFSPTVETSVGGTECASGIELCGSVCDDSKLSIGTDTTAARTTVSSEQRTSINSNRRVHHNSFEIQIPRVFKAKEAAKICNNSANKITAVIRGSKIRVRDLGEQTVLITVSAWKFDCFVQAQNLMFELLVRLFPDTQQQITLLQEPSVWHSPYTCMPHYPFGMQAKQVYATHSMVLPQVCRVSQASYVGQVYPPPLYPSAMAQTTMHVDPNAPTSTDSKAVISLMYFLEGA